MILEKGCILYSGSCLLKPSVRFYAKDGKRSVTVLEDQEALLPLRLTGEGVSTILCIICRNLTVY